MRICFLFAFPIAVGMEIALECHVPQNVVTWWGCGLALACGLAVAAWDIWHGRM